MGKDSTSHQDLRDAVACFFPDLIGDLAGLVAIPSISAVGFDPGEVRRSGEECARLLIEAGYRDVQLLEIEGAHPAVYGHNSRTRGRPPPCSSTPITMCSRSAIVTCGRPNRSSR